MHLLAVAFLLALPLVAAAAIAFGDVFDRIVAAGQLIAFMLTLGIRSFEPQRFGHLSIGIMTVDVGLAALAIWAATRTHRGWIIGTASMLLFPPMGHFAKFVEPNLWPAGYWLMTNAPAIPCAMLLAFGALQARRRMRAAATSPAFSAVASERRTPPAS